MSTPALRVNGVRYGVNDRTVCVSEYGAVGDGVTDDRTAIANAIAAAGGGSVRFPRPSVSYLVGSAITISAPVRLFAENGAGVVIERGYSPGVDSDGIFNFRDGSGFSSLEYLTLRSKTGQTGGCLVSMVQVSDAAAAIGLYRFDFCDFTTTGTSTHNHTIYMDGSAKVSAPIGIRGVDFTGCSVFGGLNSTIFCKSVLKFSFLGGGVYTAGGAGTSAITITGTSTVPSQSFIFMPADCSCPIGFDWATLGIFGCGVMGSVTNTANTSYIVGSGFTGSTQNNWTNSYFTNTNTGIIDNYGVTIRSSAPDASNDVSVIKSLATWTSGNLLRMFNNAAERFRFSATGVLSIVGGGVIGDIIGGLGTLYLGGGNTNVINLGTLSAAPVNIAAGTGSATGQVPCTLYHDTTVTPSVTSGETAGSTYTLPANTLSANGQMLRISASWTHAANANSTTFKLYFAGTAIVNSTNASSGDIIGVEVRITRTSSTTATYHAIITSTGAGIGTQRIALGALSFTTTNDIHISVTGATTNGDLSTNNLVVQYWP